MLLVVLFWVLAMIGGLLWPGAWAALLCLLAAGVFFIVRHEALAQLTGWIQLGVVGLTPWLLVLARKRHVNHLSELQVQQEAASERLSETSRTLMSLQTDTKSIEGQITAIGDLYHVTKETSRALHLQELFEASLGIAPRLLDARGLRLIDYSQDQPQLLRAVRQKDDTWIAPDSTQALTQQLLPAEEVILKRVISSGESVSSADAHELACPLPEGISRMAWAALWREKKPVGLIIADDLPKEQVKTLPVVANQLSLQLSRIHLYQQVEALAVTDSLTGLFVRNYFYERAREELERSKRHNHACTLLMIDLDRFKNKNDTYGHLVGDAVLKDVSALLQRNLREVDLIARYGGEEIILMLIETSIDQGMPIAQRLRQLVEVHPIRAYDELLSQTISIGVAGFPEHGQTLDDLIECADAALYEAKRLGRNQVVRWSSSST